VVLKRRAYRHSAECHVRTGMRQSMPSNSRPSCAGTEKLIRESRAAQNLPVLGSPAVLEKRAKPTAPHMRSAIEGATENMAIIQAAAMWFTLDCGPYGGKASEDCRLISNFLYYLPLQSHRTKSSTYAPLLAKPTPRSDNLGTSASQCFNSQLDTLPTES